MKIIAMVKFCERRIAVAHERILSNVVYQPHDQPQQVFMVSLRLGARPINVDRCACKADRRRRDTGAIITFPICTGHTEGDAREYLPLKTICSRYVS